MLKRSESTDLAFAVQRMFDIEKVRANVESVAYWRPGGHSLSENYWYNGVLTNIYEVEILEKGASVEVFAIN